MNPNLLNQSSVITPRALAADTDDYDEQEWDPAATARPVQAVPCYYQQKATDTADDGTASVDTDRLHIIWAPTVDVQAGDLVTVDGTDWTIDGEPWRVHNPRNQRVEQIEAELVRTR